MCHGTCGVCCLYSNKCYPSPEVWELVEAEQALTEEEILKLTALADGQVLIDATEQQVYRSADSATRKAHFSGKKRCLPSKLNL